VARAAVRGTLALDVSPLRAGWAYADTARPVHGLVHLPGMGSLGKLGAALRNTLQDLFELHRPARLIFAPALHAKAQTTARALIGLAFQAEVTAYDYDVEPYEIAESTARKLVLGPGVLSAIIRAGRAKAGDGSKVAKAAAMDWARGRGFTPQSDDVADALVLLEYDRVWRLSRRQWGEAA